MATIRDVARAAGVSASTVSRALSRPDVVHPETRLRIEIAVAALDWYPNPAARGLITGRTTNLGLIVPDLTNPFFPSVVKGVQARGRESGFSVFVADTDEDPTVESDLMRALGKQVDGILLCSPRMSEKELGAAAGDTPVVLLNRRVGRIPSVTVDNADAVEQAVEHLAALGHRRIAYVPGPPGSWSNRMRARALRSATDAAGVALVVVDAVPPDFGGGTIAAEAVLAAAVTAVIAYNDLIAVGLLGRFDVLDVPVPAAMSVIGFDDIFLSAMIRPGLTTLALPKELIGRAGVDLLLQLLSDPEPTAIGRRELTAQLVVRQSTGPAPGGSPGPVPVRTRKETQ